MSDESRYVVDVISSRINESSLVYDLSSVLREGHEDRWLLIINPSDKSTKKYEISSILIYENGFIEIYFNKVKKLSFDLNGDTSEADRIWNSILNRVLTFIN